MALIVKVNTRIVSAELGCIQDDNATYFDPTTGVNLSRGNPQSGDLSSFNSTQLQNIANAVKSGRLTLVSGSLPAADTSFSSYSLFATGGEPGGPGWSGLTSVSAAQPDVNGKNRGLGNTSAQELSSVNYPPNLVEHPTETPGSVF